MRRLILIRVDQDERGAGILKVDLPLRGAVWMGTRWSSGSWRKRQWVMQATASLRVNPETAMPATWRRTSSPSSGWPLHSSMEDPWS